MRALPTSLASGLLLYLAAVLASCSSSTSDEGTSAQGGVCADVCQFGAFSCTVTTIDGELESTAQISTRDANGCAGSFVGIDDDPELWIHCDTGQICVDDADDCFDGRYGALSFSYTIPDKGNVVTCDAVTR
jgi:hypothetical protein